MSDLLRYSSHSECSICLLEFPKNTHIGVKTLSCNHKFHSDCINNWICNYNNSNCPICWRDDIDLEIQPVSEKQPEIEIYTLSEIYTLLEIYSEPEIQPTPVPTQEIDNISNYVHITSKKGLVIIILIIIIILCCFFAVKII